MIFSLDNIDSPEWALVLSILTNVMMGYTVIDILIVAVNIFKHKIKWTQALVLSNMPRYTMLQNTLFWMRLLYPAIMVLLFGAMVIILLAVK